jgi:hypothetical protein
MTAKTLVTRPTLQRRALLLASALPLLAPFGAHAQSAANGITTLGVFSLLGDGLQITLPGVITDSRLDRNLRESLPTREIGFDQAALRAVTDYMARQRAGTKLQMFRATKPLSLPDQRTVAEGAAKAELPAWIIEAINSAKLSHVLIITRHRGDAAFPVTDGYTVGRGMVEGIGYYLDADTEIKNLDTGITSQGFLGAYTMVRLQLLNAVSGELLGSQDIRAGRAYAGRRDVEAENVWNALTPNEKVDALREMIRENVARVLPQVMAKA